MSLILKVSAFFKKLFGIEDPVKEPEKFTIEHPWPFPSERPVDEDFFIRQLMDGVKVVGDHVFLMRNGYPVKHMRTPEGRQTHKARHIVWWLEGNEIPDNADGLRTKCGQDDCIKLSHLTPNFRPVKKGKTEQGTAKEPDSKPQTAPVEPKKAKAEERIVVPKIDPENRLKCISRKVHFDTQREAQEYVRILNHPQIRGRGKKQYIYPCDLGCHGWHLTKTKPGDYEKKTAHYRKSKAVVW